ncbi:MAG: AAA family ATPase [Polyangiaceae bacterium]|nr:AAA family ATPase [Polyangiaceae bacterium]
MRWSVRANRETVRELVIRVRAHAPLIVCETEEEDRVITLLEAAAIEASVPLVVWRAHVGISRPTDERGMAGTEDPLAALAHIESENRETLFHLRGFEETLRDAKVLSQFQEVLRKFKSHKGAIVLSGSLIDLPASLEAYASHFRLPPPTVEEYRELVSGVIQEAQAQARTQGNTIQVQMFESDITELCHRLRGIPFERARQVLLRAIARDGQLSREDFEEIQEEKRAILSRSGVLSHVESPQDLSQVAGLSTFKDWVKKRTRSFKEPEAAKKFNLSTPRGVLLIGVQGCGKSLAAKAVAGEWQIPIVRLDPANLFSKYVGETEKTLRRALESVDAMSPLVLWVDEIEKAFSPSSDNDGGVAKRIFGTLLSWLQEHTTPVFLVATANDIASMPPEMLRKGRFDEIFFVDLPEKEQRIELFRIHLAKRGRILDEESLMEIAAATEGFSGSEIEQSVIGALHTAFSSDTELSGEQILAEIHATRPLSVTMSERISELREWAEGRAVRAD